MGTNPIDPNDVPQTSQVLEPLSELLPTIQTGALKLTHSGDPGAILARLLVSRDGSILDGYELNVAFANP